MRLQNIQNTPTLLLTLLLDSACKSTPQMFWSWSEDHVQQACCSSPSLPDQTL
jgi:hypothetical protein